MQRHLANFSKHDIEKLRAIKLTVDFSLITAMKSFRTFENTLDFE